MHIKDLSPRERRDLAKRIGRNPEYVYQVATGRRRASAEFAASVINADPRFTFESFFGDMIINATPAPKP